MSIRDIYSLLQAQLVGATCTDLIVGTSHVLDSFAKHRAKEKKELAFQPPWNFTQIV
jgi:hypothetical protein